MSYFIIGGTNVAVGQKSGGRNVCGRNVCGTYVCRTKVAPPLLPLTEPKKQFLNKRQRNFKQRIFGKRPNHFFTSTFLGRLN